MHLVLAHHFAPSHFNTFLMRHLLIFVLFAVLNLALGAPVTLWQTVTAVTNSDGSYYDPTQTVATAATLATTPTTAAAAAVATTGTTEAAGLTSSGTGLLGKIQSFLSLLESGSTSSSSDTSSGSSGIWSSLLKLFGSSSLSTANTAVAETSSTPSSTIATQASSPVASLATSASSTANLLAALNIASSAGSLTLTKTSLGSLSSSTGGIYDAIYNSDETIDTSFAKAILDAHNKVRALHGSGDLSWASAPYSYAKNNADNYDCSGVLTHTHGQYGENLAAGFADGPAALQAWYEEGETYNYNSHNSYDHFTQVVWKDSTQVGCAYKDCRAKGWGLYIVCEYNPVGNVVGESVANVLPLSS